MNFPTNNIDNPTYLSGEIMPILEVIEFNKNDGKVFNPFTSEEKATPNDLAKFCISKKDSYLIPLYLITSNDQKTNRKISRIATKIKDDYVSDMKDYYDRLSKDEQEKFIKNIRMNLMKIGKLKIFLLGTSMHGGHLLTNI